jgi:hypothetical protein
VRTAWGAGRSDENTLRIGVAVTWRCDMLPNLAVHSRYTVFGSFRFLQSLGERPGPCKYYVSLYAAFTAVTRVQIPSGTPNLFRNLRAIAELFVGTKRHKLERISTGIALQSSNVFACFEHVFTGTKRHSCNSMHYQPAAAPDACNNLMTSL